MLYIELILIGISLSIDAFSLAISLSLNKSDNNFFYNYSLMVGLFHFLMPFLGFLLRLSINSIVYIPNKELFIIIIIFLIIGIIIDKDNNKELINPILFATTVSMDGFVVGLTLTKKIVIIGSLIFSLTSFIFTTLGFILGHKIKSILEGKSKIISIGILLFILAYNLLK